jgi:5-methylcytosine-specific restriction endonuclease McrA
VKKKCTRCPRFAKPGHLHCSRCGPELRTYAYRQVQKWILAHAPMWCVLCLKGPRDHDPWTVDHRISREDGGSDHWTNLGRAHRSCNSRKGALTRMAKQKGVRGVGVT